MMGMFVDEDAQCLNISAAEVCGLGADFKLSSASLAFGIVFIALALLGLPGNILVILICVKKTSAMYRTYMLALAAVDTAICILYSVTSCVDILVSGSAEGEDEIRCPFSITNVIFCSCLTYSVFVLTMIAVDRYLSVQSPIKHRFRSRHFRLILSVLPIPAVLISILLAALEFLWIPYLNEIVAFLPFLLCSVVIFVMYVLLGYKMYRRERCRRQQVLPALVLTPLPSRASEHKLERIAKTLFIVTVAFIVSWLPFWIITLGVKWPCWLKETFILNSVMNPLIYAFMWKPFRDDVKALCQKNTKVCPFEASG